jgi:hypothetical protein
LAVAVPATDSLFVRPWPDDAIDSLGFDPRSRYVELFWLGILGPSTTWLLRRLAAELEASPAGFHLPLTDTARALGLGHMGGRHSPFVRALGRLCQFDLAQAGDGPEPALAVRRKVPPLSRRQLVRLPDHVQAAHRAWQEAELRTPAHDQLRRRCRQLALSLFELGEDVESTERQLARWRFHPALCREATAWALARHREAAEAAGGGE